MTELQRTGHFAIAAVVVAVVAVVLLWASFQSGVAQGDLPDWLLCGLVWCAP